MGRLRDSKPVRVIVLELLLPGGLGALAVLGYAPFGHYELTWLALAGLVALWWHADTRHGAWRGFVFGLGLFGCGMHWPFVSVYHYGNAPLPLAVVLVGLLDVYLALFPMLVGAFAGATRRVPRILWTLLFVPGAWLLSELVRGWGPTGFPWLSLGYVLTDSPLSSLAPVGGVYLLSFVIMLAAGTLVLLLAGSITARMISVVLIALAPVFLWLVPAARTWTQPVGTPVSVAIVQGNFPQAVKWDTDWFVPTLRRYRRLTAHARADLVIWPEVAIPTVADYVRDYMTSIDRNAAARDQTVLAGVLTQAPDDGYYNTVEALGAGHGHYDKRHLVPFGEYFPLPDFVKQWMDTIDMRYSNLARGADNQPLIRAAGTRLGLSICFEDAFAYEVDRALPEAGLLVNVTNDAWFAGTVAAAQHLNISRMRALEGGRPLLRAANTGISAVIGPTGRIIKRTGQFQVAVVNARVQPRSGATPYVRFGDMPVWLGSAVLTLGGLFWMLLARRRRANGRQQG